MSDESPVYEPGAGERIGISAENALKLAVRESTDVILKISAEDVLVSPEDSVDSIVEKIRLEIKKVTGDIVIEKGSEQDRQSYEDHVGTISDIDCKNISELLAWLKKLYELQRKTHIEDNSMAQIIIQTLETNGYIMGYKPKITSEGNSPSPEETIKGVIGGLMETLQSDGVLRNFHMNAIERQKGAFQGK